MIIDFASLANNALARYDRFAIATLELDQTPLLYREGRQFYACDRLVEPLTDSEDFEHVSCWLVTYI